MLISDYAKSRYFDCLTTWSDAVRTLLLIACLLLPSMPGHAQQRGTNNPMDNHMRLTFEGKNLPIASGAVLCLQPNSVSPANRNYSDVQLRSLYCFRTGRQMSGYVTNVYPATNPRGDYIVRVQVPLPDNTIETFWVLFSEMAQGVK